MICRSKRIPLLALIWGVLGIIPLTLAQSPDLKENKLYPEIKVLSSGVYDFGGIIIDQNDLSFSFEAKCNQISGLVEYALVHENGKTHESLFTTKIAPRLIHACFLLLKQKPDNFLLKKEKFSEQEISALRKKSLETWVRWDENGSSCRKSLTSMTLNDLSKQTLKGKSFVFTGSKVVEGDYLAQMDGSIIAIYQDARAVINAIDELSSNDDVWLPNEVNLPPLGKNVWISIRLPEI